MCYLGYIFVVGGKNDSGNIHSPYSAIFVSSLFYECPKCVSHLI